MPVRWRTRSTAGVRRRELDLALGLAGLGLVAEVVEHVPAGIQVVGGLAVKNR